jgi:NitT/TauT family transport system permease protein
LSTDTEQGAATVAGPSGVVPSSMPPLAASGRTRGKRHSAIGRLRGDLPRGLQAALVVGGLASVVVAWSVAAVAMGSNDHQLPTPWSTWGALVQLQRDGVLWGDVGASVQRVAIGYAISMVIGVAIGTLIASFRSVEAFVEAPIGFLRYIPASALTPLFLLWFGIDETPKVALVVVGTVFFNVLMVADVARAVPQELVNASYTLGAGRFTVLRRVILPHSYPGIIDVARINLAAGWVMLVVGELLAAEQGLAFRVTRASRTRAADRIFALLVVFGLIGMVSDVALRQLRKRTAPWSEGSR